MTILENGCVISKKYEIDFISFYLNLRNNKEFSIIKKNANEDVVKTIIGNKCDLDDRRVISTEKGQEMAKNHNIPFLETSAKTNVNITRAFHDMTMRILDKVKFLF